MICYSGREKMWNTILMVLSFALFICLPIFSKESTIMLVAEIFSLSLFAISINLLLGYTGMIPFGHAAFYGLGVYSFAIMLKKAGLSFPLALVLAPLITSLIGIMIGFFCIRVVGLKFAMLSLAFGQIVWAIIYKWYSFTGGDNGIMDIPLPAFLYNPTICYYFILIIFILSLFVIWKIINSPFGWTLESIRENAQRVYFIGTDTRHYQLIAFAISSFFAGLAGALFVLVSHNAFAEYVFWSKGGEGLIMVVLGGMYSFFGPIIGAFAMVLLHTFILTHTEYWPFLLGMILLVIMLFAPQGIVGVLGKTVLKK
jgi:branched-chain amino acid transport system permease protein